MSEEPFTDDDVDAGRGALYENRGRTLSTTDQARIVLAAVAPSIAARAKQDAYKDRSPGWKAAYEAGYEDGQRDALRQVKGKP